MCLLALLFRVVPDAPVVLGANREEAYARGGEPPRILGRRHRFIAGTDPRAGGTWLGVNEHGLLIAVTNRPKTVLPPLPRSRGLLARDLLDLTSAEEAVTHAMKALGQGGYDGCNLLCTQGDRAAVIHAGDQLCLRWLTAGIHIITSADADNDADRRLVYARQWLRQHSFAHIQSAVTALQELCAQNGRDGQPPICLHDSEAGTVSSTIIALRSTLENSIYLHAQGPPDTTPYVSYSHLLKEVAHPSRRSS